MGSHTRFLSFLFRVSGWIDLCPMVSVPSLWFLHILLVTPSSGVMARPVHVWDPGTG